MNVQALLDRKWAMPLLTLLFTGALVLREHFSGGVVTHHLLADEEMPGVSNWWGLLIIPLVALIVVSIIKRREAKRQDDQAKNHAAIAKRFVAGLVFGIAMGVLWEFGQEAILQYLILLPVALSFFVRVHWPESYLGFVLGMLYTFGGILPVIFGIVLTILCFIANKLIGGGIRYLLAKF